MSKIKLEVAQRRIESLKKRFGTAHLYLAYHAAFPLALTPDLLYRLWANFQLDIHGEILGIPWIAVADLLLSSLCDEVGHELYEMNVVVRNILLNRLQEDDKFGQKRINELSDFLLNYVRQQLQSDDPDIKDFALAQRWIALAYTRSNQATRELASALKSAYSQDKADLIRLASLMETLAEPLGEWEEFQPLLIYARGMGNFVGGNLEVAKNELGKVIGKGNEITVAGIELPIPEQIRAKNLSRRQVIQYLGWGGVGFGLVAIAGDSSMPPQKPDSFSKNPDFLPQSVLLKTVQFEVVTVDEQGSIRDRRFSQANFFTENLGNGVTLDMVEIPGGTFVMGSPPGEEGGDSSERPQHSVTIQPFFMGKYTVTQEQYQAVMGNNPSNFKGAKKPVENVSWDQATKFCAKLSKSGRTTYRLPSEAEWEYACRAGTTTPFYFGPTITTALVNYDGNYPYGYAPKGEYREQTTNVGSFPPNAFGLYDMHGNIWEWCLDIWHEFSDGTLVDGKTLLAVNNNQTQSLHGGSWNYDALYCRSAYRDRYARDGSYDLVGFRVVVSAAITLGMSELMNGNSLSVPNKSLDLLQ
ncbi:MAG: formylglycine-generating enzyme family protein [Rhizonema sp. NSF051]|nr:formylglycine-generating enzyme family protein [Rhizonema sp. NSF051]